MCGRNFKVHNYRTKSAKHCSPECYFKYRWGAEGRKESKRKNTAKLTIAICKHCENEFEYIFITGGRRKVCADCIIIKKKKAMQKYGQTAKSKAINKRYRLTERGKMLRLIAAKKYYNTKKGRKKVRNYRNTDKYKEVAKRYGEEKRENLWSDYIKTLLASSLKIERKDITLDMIELKRMQIKFHRELKKGKEISNEFY